MERASTVLHPALLPRLQLISHNPHASPATDPDAPLGPGYAPLGYDGSDDDCDDFGEDIFDERDVDDAPEARALAARATDEPSPDDFGWYNPRRYLGRPR